MISQIEREELAKIILSTDDETLINQAKDLLFVQNSWESLPKQVKDDVTTSIKELEEGLGIPHTKAMKKYGKWL
ncbi:MAG: hypothetical protein H7Y13_10785 [Sphingobacteriaceae bacterium]|nr:hypothetical protein [Sphingobacteriaceae bacterium]